MRKLASLWILAVAVCGCGSPSPNDRILGSWQVEMGNSIEITETFEKGGKVTVDVRNYGIGTNMTGTYKIEGDQISLTIDKTVPIDLPPEESARFQQDWKEKAPMANTGRLEWHGDDEITITSAKGVNRLKRLRDQPK